MERRISARADATVTRVAKQTTAREADAAAVVQTLRRLFKAIRIYSKGIQTATGLSGPQVWALAILFDEPGISLGTLSERMFAHPSTLSGVVERLVQRGAVRRDPDPQDRRGVCLSLTPEGRRLLRRSPPPVQHGMRRALLAFAPSRLRELRRSLEQVARETEADRLDAPLLED